MGFQQSISSMIDKVASNMATISNSYIYTGASISLAGSGPNANSRMNLNEEVYYRFLRTSHVVGACVDIFASTLAETIEKASFDITVHEDPNSYESNLCNTFLKEADIREYIKTHVHEFVYRGQYSVGIDPKNNKIFDLINYADADIVTEFGEIIGFRLNLKYIPLPYMATYYYKASPIHPLDDTENQSEDVKARTTSPGYVAPPSAMAKSAVNKRAEQGTLDDVIVRYAKFKGESIFKNHLQRLFRLYVLEYALFYLGLRDTLRPEILGLATGGKQVNIPQTLNMAHNVESLLNQSTNGLANIVDPLAFINNLTFQILNYVKVVPSVEQYQPISEINSGELSEKRQQLQNEHEKLLSEILNDLTIPTELYSGNANRWSVMANNDRFMTTCDVMLKSITRFVKNICQSVLQANGIKVKFSDIKFGLDFASMLSAFDVKSKLEGLDTKISSIQHIAQSIGDITQSGIIDQKAFMKYLKTQIAGIDTTLADMILEEPAPPPDQGGGGGEGGGPPPDGGGPPPDQDLAGGGGEEMQYVG